MKKLFTAFLLVCVGSQINAQTVENFDGYSTFPDSYLDSNFTGVNGINWSFKEARNTSAAYQINSTSMLLRRISDSSSVSATNIPGGISSLSVKLKKGFTGGGDRQVEAFVNGVSVGQSLTFDDSLIHDFEITGLTDTGNFDLMILNVKSKQVVIDDITWVSSGGASTTPSIAFSNPADTMNIEISAGNLPTIENLNFTSSNVPVGAVIASGIISPSNDTTSSLSATSPIELNITEFGVYTVAVAVVDLMAGPIAADTIYVNVEELTIDSVATIADLRAGTLGQLYTLTGEAVITYLQDFRNQKYIQDATGAILIDDNDDVITGTFNRLDGMTNITGELAEYGGLKQFVPTVDVTMASSTGNTVTPQIITVDELNSNIDMYESELVTIEDATVTSADTNIFETGKNLTITDASGNGVFRTQLFDADYISTVIPGVSDYTGLAIRFNTTAQFVSRDLADIVTANIGIEEHTEFTLFPNPTSNVLNINFVDANEKVVSIYNTIGVNVANFTANSDLKVNTSAYNSGMYYLVVTEKGNSTVKQFIVK